ncbi:DotU family type VI secretion system protein [Pigmentiphaga soli]|uniref:DotU family type VI secretion system protein n=1 Tax=Pigmentiphaga soli TaxID=1007095 RepID=A0ABP8H2N4_9BURK
MTQKPGGDPFAAFESDRTLIKPRPGGRATNAAAPAAPPRAAPPAADAPALGLDQLFGLGGGINPLIDAAQPLLQLAVQIRAMPGCPDPAALRQRIAQMIRRFEREAASGPRAALPEHVVAARYVLCTFLDEAVAGTPWGAGTWSEQSLLVMFHNETWGGEKVFQLLSRLAQNPARHLPMLELVYAVLSLGFEGRYRVDDNGRQQVATVRERLYRMIRKERGEPEPELSPQWQGVATQRRRVTDALPVWVVASLAAVLLAGLYFVLDFALNGRSDQAFSAIAAVRTPPPPPTVVRQAPKPRLAQLLATDIRAGVLAVNDEVDRSIVTLRGDGLFASGSADVSEALKPTLARIGEALASLPGRVEVTGHTDNVPIRSARYPSNWHLSQDRAASVAALLGRYVDPSRIKATGKADTEPVAPNDSAAGRSRNRRVEVVLAVEPAGAQITAAKP